ncbi:PP2C family protein-serine/threonine phosphatase [Schaalia suimastitidis]|uniref:PP2C family protein-serine/threonine phosphatase n=1 Tax=Schaalia suimastitidis TaxID=121163 RepID=UPI000427274B|nr:PP2C family serine/threonine-protein phosphatase [Schaalia suimastitidis]
MAVVEFHSAARSDVGLVRVNNQDSGYAGSNLLLLADGMGGPAGGDIASSVAVAHFVPLDTDTHPAESLLPLLRKALMDAHEELTERSSHDPDLVGLGTTCIAILRSGNKLAMVHIGDSRAYVLRGGTLTQVTTDHSFVQYLVDTGQISAEEAEHHPKRNVVMRILGDLQADTTPDETIREAVVGDRWLLCSDGLSGVVSTDTIGEVLGSIADPGQCAEELIRLALLAGGPDNITCVVADVVPSGTVPPAPAQVVGAAASNRQIPTRGGGGAAARAAALSAPTPQPDASPPDTDDETPRQRRGSWWAPVATFLLAAVIIAGSWIGWTWSQTQYYALGVDGKVVIHQGIPQSIGPWELSRAVEITNVNLADLEPVDQQRLTEPVIRSSRELIDAYVAQLELGIAQRQAAQANTQISSANSGTTTTTHTTGDASATQETPTEGNP